MLPAFVLVEGAASLGCPVLGHVFGRTLHERLDIALRADCTCSDAATSAAARHCRPARR